MAFYDWNKDGKKDFVDDYIEYNIYEECTKDDDKQSNYSNDNSGCGFCLWYFIIVFILWIITET